jgi:glyoxylase-like metal-dependent hydrolase (beta-lactamase superfamily II)
MLEVACFVCGPLENNVYLVICTETGRCAVIDPGLETEAVLEAINARGLGVDYVLNTHGHFDHVFSNALYVATFGAMLAIHPGDLAFLRQMPQTAESWGFPGAEPSPEPGLLLEHGAVLKLGLHVLAVRHTPGHSPGQVAFCCPGHALVGDTLFYRGIGRWDLPGADYSALEHSVREQLYTLPGETLVWPGHGPHTTIGEEQRLNPYIGDGARFLPKV